MIQQMKINSRSSSHRGMSATYDYERWDGLYHDGDGVALSLPYSANENKQILNRYSVVTIHVIIRTLILFPYPNESSRCTVVF